MKESGRDAATRKIKEMSEERLAKVLIFMAGMEAEDAIIKSDGHTAKTTDRESA